MHNIFTPLTNLLELSAKDLLCRAILLEGEVVKKRFGLVGKLELV